MASGTLNVPDNGDSLLEGWWMVFTVVQWHKLSQRQRMSCVVPGSEGTERARDKVLEGMDTMVAGVKNEGV